MKNQKQYKVTIKTCKEKQSIEKRKKYVILAKKNLKQYKMKIGIDIREASKQKTGKGWYTYNIVKEILKQDKNNTYILYSDDEENPFINRKNVTFKKIKEKGIKWHLNTLKAIKEDKIDIFFAPTSYIIPALAPKTLKTVITIHDLVAFLYPKSHNKKSVIIEKLTLKKALKKASAILVVSKNTEKDIKNKFKTNKQIKITYCAPSYSLKARVTKEEKENFRKKLNLPEKFILAVGTLEPRKNLSTVIKSFVLIKKKHPEYKLVIVGKKGWNCNKLEETLKEFKLENDVIFTGYLEKEDLIMTYKLADIFVFLSLYEGFGIPPLEAMSAGCPVISSNTSSLPEVVGEAGLLIDPLSSHKLADEIIGLIENPNIREMMIERGLEQAKKFNWADSAKIAIDTFNSLKNE